MKTPDAYILSLFKKEPEPTEIQKTIEDNVTNGLGYESRTQYVTMKSDQLFEGIARDSQIHDTPEGLKIHLAEMDARINPSERLRSIIKAYKQVAVGMAELPYMEIADRYIFIDFTDDFDSYVFGRSETDFSQEIDQNKIDQKNWEGTSLTMNPLPDLLKVAQQYKDCTDYVMDETFKRTQRQEELSNGYVDKILRDFQIEE